MLHKKQQKIITTTLETVDSMEFAYIHGSAVYADKYHDIDIAIFLTPLKFKEIMGKASITLDMLMPLENDLEHALHVPVDVQVLNNAPLSFRYTVVNKNIVLIDKNPSLREQFELLSRVEYYDFRPRIEEYIREALSWN